MFYKKLLRYGLPVMAGAVVLGTMAFTKPSETVQFVAGAENVLNVSANTETVQKLIEEAEKKAMNAGVATVLELSGDASQISREDIEQVDFWGYNNIGIAQVDNHLNVRKEPNESGKLVGKMSNNTACEILSISDDGRWAQIISGEVEGYVCTDYLLMGMDAVKAAEAIVKPMAIVEADALNIRIEPNTECEIVTTIPHGESLELSQVLEDGWVEILLDGDKVYAAAEFVTIEEKLGTAITMTELLYGEGVSDVRVDLCQYAKQFIGNPYVWGGTSLTNGADCSGFVLSVFKNYGVTLPHHSGSQAQYGTYVSMNDIQAGDLVFYGYGKTINHVAIYIGNGQVVHASSPSTGIKISSVYYRTPITQRSILID
ncbi:MAG: C40 family peptidase [Lachnospiraceae bacterium]|nr:C40 family peptidase [Lachnospiraceae bacterium]